MNLENTVKQMLSDDYKERFKAEYYQLKIRYDRLRNMYENWNKLAFVPTYPKSIYKEQLQAMNKYMVILEERARLEDIDLTRI